MAYDYNISARTLLVTLSVSQWSARREDKRETADVTAKHGAKARAARVNKSLFPSCNELADIHKATAELRNYIMRVSLPWMNNGQRIIKSSGYLELTQQIASRKNKWEGLVNKFVSDYDNHVARAAYDLGTLYDANDYPSAQQVRRMFGIDVIFSPVPTTDDFRVSMSNEHLDKIKADLEEATRAQVEDSMGAAYSRLRDVLSHAAEKLSQPDAIFRNSLVENVRELCENIDSLNITNDKRLTRLADDMADLFNHFDPNDLRKDESCRRIVADKSKQAVAEVDKIMGAFGAFMGA
jgi:hypothetical protein